MVRVSLRVSIQLGVDGAQPVDVRDRQAMLNGACDHKSPVPREWQEALIDPGCNVGRGLEHLSPALDLDVHLFVTETQSFGMVQMLLLMCWNHIQNAMDN